LIGEFILNKEEIKSAIFEYMSNRIQINTGDHIKSMSDEDIKALPESITMLYVKRI